jgi:hypothetical protein
MKGYTYTVKLNGGGKIALPKQVDLAIIFQISI